eukprot:scaffold278527_cov26-Tisochrysis_lutea.AAC.5
MVAVVFTPYELLPLSSPRSASAGSRAALGGGADVPPHDSPELTRSSRAAALLAAAAATQPPPSRWRKAIEALLHSWPCMVAANEPLAQGSGPAAAASDASRTTAGVISSKSASTAIVSISVPIHATCAESALISLFASGAALAI